MKVSEAMTRGVATCSVEDSAADAARVMWDRDCGFVPVVEGDRLRGVVTDRDLLMAAQMRGASLKDLRLSSLVPGSVKTCREDDEIPVALATMSDNQIRRLPVVDRNGRLTGILSMNDVAIRAQSDERHMVNVARTLAAISRHRTPAAPAR